MSNSHSVPGSLSGYLYQVRIALLESLRRLRKGHAFTIRLEALDDVSFEKDGEAPELLQSKHHLGRSADLTDFSVDLWKTLNVWCDGIRAGQVSTDASFFLITTAQSPAGSAASYLGSQDARDPEKALERLNSAAASSANASLKSALASFRQLSLAQKKSLLESITIVDAAIDISQLDSAIDEELFHAVEPKFLRLLAQRLEGWWLRRCVKQLIDPAGKGILSEEIIAEESHLREQFRQDSLPVDDDLMQASVDASGYVTKRFVHQLKLIEIGNNRIVQAIRDFFRAYEQRSRWIREDLVLVGELDRYESRLIEEWRLRFNQLCDEVGQEASDAAQKTAARDLYKWVETGNLLPIRTGVTEGCIARGSYHMLADEMKVGWHPAFLERLKILLEGAAADS